MSHMIAGVAGATCVAAGVPCYAQARDAAAAEVLFREGRRALEEDKYQEADQKFAESQRLDPGAGTLMNLATCEEKLGRWASAWQHWREAIDTLPAGDGRIQFARARVTELEKRLPRLTVVLGAEDDAGARVFRDDVELGKASRGIPVPVDPGPHAITVQTAGRIPASFAFTIAEGEQKLIAVHPGAVDREEARNPLMDRPARRVGWVLGGVGLAGIGAAVVTGVVLAGKKSTVEAECPHKVCATQAGLDAAASGRTLVVVNSVAWIVGGLALGASAYLVFAERGPLLGLVPGIGPKGAALSYRGNF